MDFPYRSAYINNMSAKQKPDDISSFTDTILENLTNGEAWSNLLFGPYQTGDIYLELLKKIDAGVEQDIDLNLLSEPAKDRLFEVLMLRFDILNEHRDAYRALFIETFKNPKLFRIALPQFHQSMELMLRLADLNGRDDRSCAPMRVGGIALVYLNAVRVWLNDDSADMSATMAELDNGLSKIDMAFDRMPEFLRSFI